MPTLLFKGLQIQFSQLGRRLKAGWEIADVSK